MYNQTKSPTSISDLMNASVALIELPPFSPDTEFVARVRRPSLMTMVSQGKIPNALLKAAESLFMGKSKKDSESIDIKSTYEVMDLICEAALVEPSYQELKEAGIDMTDAQRIFLFNYSQGGIESLYKFRPKHKNPRDHRNGEQVQGEAVKTD